MEFILFILAPLGITYYLLTTWIQKRPDKHGRLYRFLRSILMQNLDSPFEVLQYGYGMIGIVCLFCSSIKEIREMCETIAGYCFAILILNALVLTFWYKITRRDFDAIFKSEKGDSIQ